MNALQTLRQIAWHTQRLTWGEGDNHPVFHYGSVLTAGAIVRSRFAELIPPILALFPGNAQADPEIHGLANLTVQARLTVVAEDERGETCLVGGHRIDEGRSPGRGMLEIEAAWLEALDLLNHTVGIHLTGGFTGSVETTWEEGIGFIVTRVYSFECPTTVAPYYTPPVRLVATAPGGGAASLAWANPPERFDLHAATAWEAARGEMILRRASGSTAPATASAGSAVALGGALATSVTDTPGAGTWTYALFASYDEGRGGPARSSAQETGTTRTVVVT